MTTQLYRVGQAAVTVRDPDIPISKERARIQAQKRTLDGSMKQHIANVKWVWNLTWKMLTTAEYTTLIAELIREESMTFKPPDTATTYTIVMAGNVGVSNNAFGCHDVTAKLEEV